MDELGARIAHSDIPNFAVHPFFVADKQASFSIAWPLHDVAERQQVTRNFLPGCPRGPEREARLSVWFPQRRNDELCRQLNAGRCDRLSALTAKHQEKTSVDRFAALTAPVGAIAKGPQPLKVFCNVQLIREAFARRPEFSVVADDGAADVVWLYEQVADFGSIRASVYVNQIPNEDVITLKDMLQHTIHTSIGQPAWFSPSCAVFVRRSFFPSRLSMQIISETSCFISWASIIDEKKQVNTTRGS